jgi:hypothetical protein
MQTNQENSSGSNRVRKLLDDAERSASSAIRLMRASLASAAPGNVAPLLEDVVQLFALIDAADLRAELARQTAGEEAVEHAEDARSLAIAAHDEALRRTKRWALTLRHEA